MPAEADRLAADQSGPAAGIQRFLDEAARPVDAAASAEKRHADSVGRARPSEQEAEEATRQLAAIREGSQSQQEEASSLRAEAAGLTNAWQPKSRSAEDGG